MKKSVILTSVLLCLMFISTVFAGDTGNGGRAACNPEVEQCQTSAPTVTTTLLTIFSQIVALVK